MKDLLKDFKIQSVLRQLSPQTIDLLVKRFCNEPKPDLKSIRKDKKKRDVLQAITEAVSDHSHCVRALRVAHFFQKNRDAFLRLRPYLTEHCEQEIEWGKIDGVKKTSIRSFFSTWNRKGRLAIISSCAYIRSRARCIVLAATITLGA